MFRLKVAGMEMIVKTRPPETTLLSLSAAVPRRPDRRDDSREFSMLRIGCLLFDDRRELCLIRNISAGGSLVRTYSQVPVGQQVAIELRQGESIAGTVRWSEGNMVGIMFNQLVDVVALLATSSEWPRPRQPRVEVNCIAWLKQGSKTSVAKALDLSQGGVKIRSKQVPDLGEIMVSIRGLPDLSATYRWTSGDTHGLAFRDPLPLNLLVRWVREQQEGRGRALAAGGQAA